ncbi:Bacteriophage HK97-gp10, putative tail-component [Acetitomaculum ruminis DSM 5522]|uniref:Bacteriophage HK97-gp10, putative tail-component n=1 Tax=Acetitomaculum ruminis DSM 5522 TaxID=1120918 RepID=A0A1I0WGA1_9FIRM|nr:HK97 gp10 family phage protein [Acetitomaculum ruminis]SFA87594.1 Bacteriophage HK97-gp10, putative tail-component [Acetitomaculum ruminis DSM 5522]
MAAQYRQLKEFQKKVMRLNGAQRDEFFTSTLNELGARLLRKTKIKTPVDTGILRRGWKVDPAGKTASGYQITISNPIEYASYVEYGHRTKNRSGWVNGKFMLTKSKSEIKSIMPGLLNRRLTRYLSEGLS